MLDRRRLLSLLGAGAAWTALPGLAHAARAEEPEHTLRVGTMFVRDTPWAKVVSVWARHVEKQALGQLGLSVQHNGSERIIDESELARRLSVGLLDVGLLSTVGLGTLAPAVQALHLPRLYPDWAAGDRVLAALRQDLEQQLAAQGLTTLGWGKLGVRLLLAQDTALRAPADLAAQRLYLPRGDRAQAALAASLGMAGTLELDVIAVQRRIRKGLVNTVVSTATQALSRGWAGGGALTHLTRTPLGFEWGALVVRTEALQALPEHLRALVLGTGPIATQNLGERAIELDGVALAALEERVEVLTTSDAEAALWDEAGAQAIAGLVRDGWLGQDLIDRARTAAAG